MEKQLEGQVPEEHRQKKQSKKIGRSIAVSLLVFALWTYWPKRTEYLPFPYDPSSLDEGISDEDIIYKPFSWNDVASKPYLDYVPCYGGEYQCARLELPMDYWNDTTNATVSVAVIKQPAIVPVTDPRYGGVTIHNPGGPGGSGVGFLLGAAPLLRAVIDSDEEGGKYFDHLSFDPRGIGATKPSVNCFHDFEADVQWVIRLAEQGIFSASDAAFGRLWSMDTARWQSCSLPVPEGGIDIKKYVSTASVARDMLEIVERHGEWREKEAVRLSKLGIKCDGNIAGESDSLPNDVFERVMYKPGKEKINYWGFSYGSYLGNTFAAMFPDRINRLIVDGVVDAYDYKKALWLDNLVDTERGLELFYYHCARVGYPMCALANEHGTTTEESVKQRMNNITQSLYHNPLPIISSSGPEVVTYSTVKFLTFAVLYTPIGGFEYLANILYGIEKGDLFGVAQQLQDLRGFIGLPGRDAYTVNSDDDDGFDIAGDAQTAIACGDGDSQTWMTKADFAEHLKNITEISPIAEMWATLRLKCIHWNIRPESRFEGPWVGNTSHPILEIGNSADPVTPGRYAVKMAKGFTNAVALIQDSGGHCSISAPSKCTENYVKQYFQTGELPPKDKICKPDILPFGPGSNEVGAAVIDEEADKLLERQSGIARALYASGGGFLNEGFRTTMFALQ